VLGVYQGLAAFLRAFSVVLAGRSLEAEMSSLKSFLTTSTQSAWRLLNEVKNVKAWALLALRDNATYIKSLHGMVLGEDNHVCRGCVCHAPSYSMNRTRPDSLGGP
jgi:hypothetical protein